MTAALLHDARIMAVDDEPANLKLLQKVLESGGHAAPELVQDPREVLARYAVRRPDLILLDLNMPHLDGYGVLEALAGLGDPLLPPVVVLTAQSGREHVLRALQLGARDFLSKPFDRLELLMRVRNLLEAQLAHRLLHDQRDTLEALVRARTRELADTRVEILERLARAAEFRDNETGLHTVRMSHFSALLARRLGWSEARAELLRLASPLHDLGKIGIPDAILLKPGPLDPDEWTVMRTHPAIGARILGGGDSELLRLAAEIAGAHHEKWDGSGYPGGLAGEAIPLCARIVAVADVFDALTTARPYKTAWSVEDAVAHLRAQAGRRFDPALVEAFIDALPEVLELRERFREPD